jgi:hypothetical protein
MTDMSDMTEETVEISDEELEEMVEEALDILALALPDDADDAYWAQVRATVEQRAADLMVEVPDEG